MDKLVIISHTPHYQVGDQITGWGPTVEEINQISKNWKEVVHIACFYKSEISVGGGLPYTAPNVRFVPIPPFGGADIWSKLAVFLKIPKILEPIKKETKTATHVQLRVPTGMANILLPWFSIKKRPYTFWVKYAGNWKEPNPPLGYAFQQWWLSRNLTKCRVTLNGMWPDQPKHCYSFENPCLTDEEISEGETVGSNKQFSAPYTLIFVGRLDRSKGVDTILEAIPDLDRSFIESIHFIGDSPDRKKYEEMSKDSKIPCIFHGYLPRQKIHPLLAISHFLLLPSESEGFPKVVAEGACYGAIPIVSSVSSIPHYINDSNGFLWKSRESYAEILNKALHENEETLLTKSRQILKLAPLFTFSHYFHSLKTKIFS